MCPGFELENLLQWHTEHRSDPECHFEGRGVLVLFDRVDRLPGHAHFSASFAWVISPWLNLRVRMLLVMWDCVLPISEAPAVMENDRAGFNQLCNHHH
jgi:hypothetical protein